VQQPLSDGGSPVRAGGHGEDRAEYRRLPRHHRPHGGGGKLPLYGPAGAAEERGVSRWRRSRFTRSSSSSRTC
ncbi:XRE family transcriptional regulator, partial [Dysosmobacter welbionis]